MSKILVAGLTNIETTLKIDGFPVHYQPVNYPFFGINSTVTGVGVNVAKGLTILGNKVNYLTQIGDDEEGERSIHVIEQDGLDAKYTVKNLKSTPQSVILYDNDGKREIFVDLKDIQEVSYPTDLADEALKECDTAVICNINFARPLLHKAREAGVTIATDVHVLTDIHDPYNYDFMRDSNILFLSNEGIQGHEEDFAWRLVESYNSDIIVVGLGNQGALLYVRKDNFMGRFDAVNTREIVNTIGAGDALFTSFVHFYTKDHDPYTALKKAIVFASYKIGDKGAAEGMLSEPELNDLFEKVYQTV